MQNVRNLVDVKIVTNAKTLKKFVDNPNFSDIRVINKGVCLVLMKQGEVRLNKPIFLGFTILELSKLLVYNFHYNYMGKKYGNYCGLLNIDTDGLVYEICTQDVYKDLKEDQAIFDFSDYPNNHFLFSNLNKKVPRKVKDEKNSKIILSFASPKAKMLSLEIMNDDSKIDTHKRAKGIKKHVINNELTHMDYLNVVLNQVLTYSKMNSFRSKTHQIGTEIKKSWPSQF